MSQGREYLRLVKDWRILIDSIAFADVDKLSDEQVGAYVEESVRLSTEIENVFMELCETHDPGFSDDPQAHLQGLGADDA